jgi:site-specific recombinase XerD
VAATPAPISPALPARCSEHPAPAQPQRLTRLDDLIAAYLRGKAPATRDAYGNDLKSRLAFCEIAPGRGRDGDLIIGVDPLEAGIHHAEMYRPLIQEKGDPRTGNRLSPASAARRCSAISKFYVDCIRQRAVAESPFLGVERPKGR